MRTLIFLLFLLSFAKADMCHDENMKIFLKTMKSQNLPLQIDNVTYLTDVECKNNTIIYHYQLDFNRIDKRITANEQMKDLMKKGVRANNKNIYCNSNLIAWHRENNIAMQWIYMLDNKEFMSVKMTVKDCEGQSSESNFYQRK